MSLLTEYPQLSNLKQSTQIITSLPFTSKPNTTTNFHDFNIKNIFFRPANDHTTKTEAPSLSLLASKCSSAFQNLTRSEEENQLCSFSNSHTLPLSSFPSSHPSLHQHLVVHNKEEEEEEEEEDNKVNNSKKIKLPAFSQFITQNHLDSAFPSTSFATSPSSSCGRCNHHTGSPNSSSLYNNSFYPFNTPYHHHHDRQPMYDQSLYTQNQRSATPPLLYKAKHSSLLSINQPILSSSRSNSLPLLPINQPPTNPELRTASTAPSSISSFKIVEFSNNKIQVNGRKGKEKQTNTEMKTGASIISNDSENGTQQTKPTKRRRKIEKIDRKLKLDIKVPVKYDSKIIDLTRSVRNRFDSKLTF